MIIQQCPLVRTVSTMSQELFRVESSYKWDIIQMKVFVACEHESTWRRPIQARRITLKRLLHGQASSLFAELSNTGHITHTHSPAGFLVTQKHYGVRSASSTNPTSEESDCHHACVSQNYSQITITIPVHCPGEPDGVSRLFFSRGCCYI